MSSASNSSDHALDVDWGRQSRADLAKLNPREADRIRLAVRRLAHSGHGNIRQLRGFDPPRIRLRVGSWRVMVEKEAGLIRVLRVLHRREAYRKSAWIQQAVHGVGDPDAGETAENEDGLAAPPTESQ